MTYVNVSITGSNTELNQAAGAVCAEALASKGFVNTALSTQDSNEPVQANSASALDVLRATHPNAFAEANVSITAFNGEGPIGGGSGGAPAAAEEIGSTLSDSKAQELGESLAEVA